MKDRIVELVKEKYQQRSDVGINKYGTTLEGNNRDSYLKHLQEELMDSTLYLEKLIQLDQEMSRLCSIHSDDKELGQAVRKLVS
jgi:hypothetical protein